MQCRIWKPLTIAIVALAAVWPFGACALGQESAPPAPPEDVELEPPVERHATSSVSGALRVVAEPESGLARPWLIRSIIESQTTVNAVLRDLKAEETPSGRRPAFGTNPPLHETIGAELTSTPGICELTLDVSSFDEALPADKLLAALLKELTQQLRRLAGQQLSAEDDQRVGIRREIESMQMRIHMLSERIGVRQGSDSSKLAAEIALQALAVQVEQQTLEARANAIAGRINQLRTEAQKLPSDDTVQALAEVVDLLSKQLEADKAFGGDRLRTELNLANAKAELSRYRASLAEGAHGQRLNELRRRLDDTSIELEEATHKRKILEEALVEVQKSMVTSTELEMLQRQLTDLWDARSRIETRIRSHRPPQIQFIRY